MVITVGEVMPLVLAAVPSFEATWAKIQDENEDPEQGHLHYIDAADVAAHLVTLLEREDSSEVMAAFQVIERLLLEGDDKVRNLAVIGYLEGIQNIAGHSEAVTAEEFVPLLGVEGARWWRGLNAFWSGDTPPPVRPID